MTAESPGRAPFEAHLHLLDFFLTHREPILERIQTLLNAQRKPTNYLQDGRQLARHFEDCFFTLPAVTEHQWNLRGQLEAALWADGFRPRDMPGLHNGLASPAEMMMRVFYLWNRTRWPGGNGRVRYAHTLFNLYLIRCLELLSMRLWDGDVKAAGARLAQLQAVLDRVWIGSSPDQPVLVRDVRWLIQLAQSPATDDLGNYFAVAERIDTTLPAADRIEVHKAGVRMTGGHLRSQIRHHSNKTGLPFDAAAVTVDTRTSNALDFALLIQELVPLLGAYEHAEGPARRDLADAICQGLSPDPELFLNLLPLLGAYSMIEDVFIATDHEGHATYTPLGRRHVALLKEYATRIACVAPRLVDDCAQFRPVPGTYSPYGVLYGFSSHLLEHMVLKASQPFAERRFALEDVFVSDTANPDTLAWVTGWRKLPHISAQVERMFEYPQAFAEAMFERVEQALRKRVADDAAAASIGRLFVVAADATPDDDETDALPSLPVQYIRSSDPHLIAAHRAEPWDDARLAADRREGRSILGYATAGGSVAISKAVLTEVLGMGRDTRVTGLPVAAAERLALLCPGLVVLPGRPPEV